MLCENCGKREANVRYSENINGVKKEMNLCEECSRKLGITNDMDIIPSLDFANFFSGFFDEPEFIPLLDGIKELKCESCGSTFDDIVNTGKYGCPNCYETFEERMDPILKKLQGANRHTGRLGKISDNKVKFEEVKENKTLSKKEELQNQLKQAVQEERYEDAAKLRDEINKLSK